MYRITDWGSPNMNDFEKETIDNAESVTDAAQETAENEVNAVIEEAAEEAPKPVRKAAAHMTASAAALNAEKSISAEENPAKSSR